MSTSIPVRAYAIASTVPLKELAFLFDGKAELTRASKTVLVARYLEGDAWAVVHDFGAVVFFGVLDVERERVVAAMRKFDVTDTGGEAPRAPLAESFRVEIKPDVARPVVGFDSIVVRELTASVREVVAFVIGQSVAMEYYEEDVDAILVRLQRVAGGLQERGRFHIGSKELLKLVGRGMSMRNRVVHTLALLDSPEQAWNDELLDRLYRELRASFGIEDRYRALDHKLQMIGDNLELFVELTQHRRSMAIEWLIVGLIAIEVVLFIATMKH
jgi:required for meiotic nuclear division protein 1